MYKHWLQSKTIWGSLISLISFVIVLCISKTAQDRYFAISGILSSIFSIYGRITAKHRITFKKVQNGKG